MSTLHQIYQISLRMMNIDVFFPVDFNAMFPRRFALLLHRISMLLMNSQRSSISVFQSEMMDNRNNFRNTTVSLLTFISVALNQWRTGTDCNRAPPRACPQRTGASRLTSCLDLSSSVPNTGLANENSLTCFIAALDSMLNYPMLLFASV